MGDIGSETDPRFLDPFSQAHDVPEIPSGIGKFPSLDSEEPEALCLFCRKIDFRKVFDIDPYTLHERTSEDAPLPKHVIAHLGKFRMDTENPWKFSSNSCELCQLIQRLSRIHTGGYNLQSEWGLNVRSFFEERLINKQFSKDIPGGQDIPFLTLDPLDGRQLIKPCLFDPYWFFLPTDRKATSVTAEQPLLSPQILQPQVDFTSLRQWLSLCQSKHRNTCQPIRRHPTGMKLMDCDSTTLSVVHAPSEAQYAALSYVWGTVDCRLEDNAPLPRTVRDAIVATKALGLRYLWVDQYCIDQTNHAEKHRQIMHMDVIYKASQVTIIAAGGDNANAGLPGVGDTPRNLQPLIRLGDVTLVSSMSSQAGVVANSKWYSRGWTLQESILSTRKLVFTKDQVHLECNAVHCQESVMLNMLLLSVEPWCSSLKQFQPPGVFGGHSRAERSRKKKALILGKRRQKRPHWDTPSPIADTEYKSLHSLIREYTSRDLTYDSDSLKAFSGILTHFTQQQPSSGKPFRCLSVRSPQLHHIYGIPFIQLPSKPFSRMAAASFVRSLSWYHKPESYPQYNETDGFPTWTVGPAPRERTREYGACPSWSWAAWAGIIYIEDNNLHDTETLRYVASPQLEVGKRKMSLVGAARALYHTHSTSLFDGAILLLKTYIPNMTCSNITFKSEHAMEINWPETRFRLEGTVHMSKSYRKESLQQALLNHKCSLAILYLGSQFTTVAMMIEEGQNHSRRVGLADLSLSARVESGVYDPWMYVVKSEKDSLRFFKECCTQKIVRIG